MVATRLIDLYETETRRDWRLAQSLSDDTLIIEMRNRGLSPLLTAVPAKLRLDTVALDTIDGTLDWGGRIIQLTPRMTEVLVCLMTAYPRAMRMKALTMAIWGDSDSLLLREIVGRMRKLIGAESIILQHRSTEFSAYQLVPPTLDGRPVVVVRGEC